MSIFTTIGNAISNFFKKEVPVVENAFAKATSVVNIIKTFLGSANGQTIEAIIEALLPGLGTVIIADLNIFFTDFGLVTNELTKSPPDIAADGLNALAKLTGNSKAIALQNVASIIGNSASNATGGNSTIQQASVAIPLVYNPTLLDNVGSTVSTASGTSPAINSASSAS